MNIFLPPPPHLPTFYHIPPLAYNEKSLFGIGKAKMNKLKKARYLLIKYRMLYPRHALKFSHSRQQLSPTPSKNPHPVEMSEKIKKVPEAQGLPVAVMLSLTPSFLPQLSGVEKSHAPRGTSSMGAGNFQTGRFHRVPSPYRPYRRPRSR